MNVRSDAAMPTTVEVAVPVPLRQTFHYSVPAALAGGVRPGVRLVVPFGLRREIGYAVAIDTPPPVGVRLVSVLGVLDPLEPVFDSGFVDWLVWLAEYYRAPIGEVFRAAHPSGMNGRVERAVAITSVGRVALHADSDEPLSDTARRTLQVLSDADEPVLVTKLRPRPDRRLVDRMRKLGWVEVEYIVDRPTVSERTDRVVRAVAPAPPEGSGARGQRLRRDDIHAWLVGRDWVTTRDVEGSFPGAALHVRTLAREGRVVFDVLAAPRDPFFGEAPETGVRPTLSADQHAAVTALGGALADDEYRGILLQGVTGSGKTEVYLHAIEAAFARDRGALVLVPEIALTPQLVRRFRGRLGDALAVLHSGLTDSARYEQWLRLRRGEVRLAIGARSAVFAPVPNLGLIILDEEHDPSFKQSEGVRYHARDMALSRGHRTRSVVVLGTATPSIESELNVQRHKLRRLVLGSRPTGGRLPEVELVDLRVHRPPNDAGRMLSVPLRNAIAETLGRGEQSILFLNRRGFSNIVLCEACGFVFECDQCAISMVFHRSEGLLRCHYCDAARALPGACPECRSGRLGLPGQGTERVEEALRKLFPVARVARLDRDTAVGRGLRDVLSAMRDGRIDILVGTQIVTKGHDYPNVTLVGVIAADAGLNFPDFRAAERTFQQLAQVAGRAGRGQRPGRVLVQSWEPEHYCLVAARRHDHAAFASEEMIRRQALGYPPFSHGASVRIDGRDADAVASFAGHVAERLRGAGAGRGGTTLKGPAMAPISVVRGRTRWSLLLLADRRRALRTLLDALDAPPLKPPGDLRMAVDVDPFALM